MFLRSRWSRETSISHCRSFEYLNLEVDRMYLELDSFVFFWYAFLIKDKIIFRVPVFSATNYLSILNILVNKFSKMFENCIQDQLKKEDFKLSFYLLQTIAVDS